MSKWWFVELFRWRWSLTREKERAQGLEGFHNDVEMYVEIDLSGDALSDGRNITILHVLERREA